MSTRVINLSSGEELFYGLPPREAVLAAYAREQSPLIRWWEDLEALYGDRVTETARVLLCGDFSALLVPGAPAEPAEGAEAERRFW